MQHNNVKFLAITLFCMELTGLKAQNVKDIDGNVYKTITIGTQVWMAENLKTTKYSNGDSIGTTTPATFDITTGNTPKYQWVYDGNESNDETYGRLYTWYVVTDNRNVCPAGWHVPADTEWTILTEYLTKNGYGYKGSESDISKSMAATSGWMTNSILGNVGNDQRSNNSCGFTAFPGGYRYGSGLFNGSGSFSYWWTSTEAYPTTAWYRSLSDHCNDLYRDSSSKQNGISIRCLRNK